MNVPYIPGNAPPPNLPLGRFLPPIPQGMADAWCKANLQPGDWVLEPFGFNPLIAIEIAAAGFPVLVCVNNPIHAFMLRVLASAPQPQEMIAALQDLAIATKGESRMEPYIRSLYQISCPKCRHQVEVDAFLWKKDTEQPFAAQLMCQFCGASGEQTLTPESLESLTPLPPKHLHLARALNRIAERDDALRLQVENALNAYPSRPLIILQTIINRLENLEQTPRRRELLTAMILSAADRGNSMWAYPNPRSRPRQITQPTIYQEQNLWKVLEGSATAWQVIKHPVPISNWQEIQNEPLGIYLYRGRIRELTPRPPSGFFSAVFAAIPRPNQAFWTFSALWAGWIWGQDAVAPIRQVLTRQRYDWNWHCQALMGVFDAIHSHNHPSLKYWGVIAENEPMLFLASLLAADVRRFKLQAFAHSVDDQLAQCEWSPIEVSTDRPHPDIFLAAARQAVVNFLKTKGEPGSFQQIHTAILSTLAHQNQLAMDVFLQNIHQAVSETQRLIESVFIEPNLFIKVSDEKAALETSDWWLTTPGVINTTMIDQLEEKILAHLVSVETTTAEQVKQVAYKALPGVYTPNNEMIINCLSSYAVCLTDESCKDLEGKPAQKWVIKDFELPSARQKDQVNILENLSQIAHRLNYLVSGQNPMNWHEKEDEGLVYRVQVLTSAIVSPYLNPPQDDLLNAPSKNSDQRQQPKKLILVIPGSRANLLAYKQNRDPILKKRMGHDVLVVKYRLVRDLYANPLLSRELFTDMITADPPEYHASQLALL